MFCRFCGKTMPGDAVFCPYCGKKTVSTGDIAACGQHDMGEKIDCGLSRAILAVVVGNVVGIVALIYSVLASTMLKSGDLEGARAAARKSKLWSWAAYISWGVLMLISIIFLQYALKSIDLSGFNV